MKASELRELTATELETKLGDLKKELFNLKFQNSTNQLENPQRIVAVKKDIARVNTLLRQLELQESK
ncbi:MAG: 50S ribosomal protein L29 [Ruminococcus sp.]|nr:50S ribosomal protein L29 [Ruminococcus sp.]